MSFTLCDADRLTVMGIYARAENANPGKIGDLWRSFHAMGNVAAIPGRADDSVYCVYCEYETDFMGGFTVLVGCAVEGDTAVPEGMKKLEIEAGKFVVFDVVGELPKSIFEAWAEIWNMPLDRRYQADFDRYGSDGKVTIHAGVR